MAASNRSKTSLLLGESLLAEGMINNNQLQHALQVQQDAVDRRRLGEILVDLGYLTKRQLREVSRKYQHRLQIGSLLVESGVITEEQLAEALAIQRDTRQMLGDILIGREVISEEQFALALSRQVDHAYIVPNKRLVDRSLLRGFPPQFLRQNVVLPLFENEGVVTFLVANPLDSTLIQLLSNYVKQEFDLAVGPRSAIEKVLNEALDEASLLSYPGGRQSDSEDGANTIFSRYELDKEGRGKGAEAQAVNIVDYLLTNAIRDRASDIHIEPLNDRLRVRHRIDGQLILSTELPMHFRDPVLRRIKVLSRIDVVDFSRSADGNAYVKLDGKEIDLRVSICETVFGYSITIRLLSKEIGLRDLEDLGMLRRELLSLREMLDTTSGLVIFAGPTGAGKTTSLYACLNYLNQKNLKICTVESPVECHIEGIAQSQVKGGQEGQVQEMARAMLHQDPDVLVLGEINDSESATTLIQAAVSGHKAFSTLHTEDSLGALFRMMDMGLHAYLVSSTGLIFVSQRLLRRICPQCKVTSAPSRELLRQFNLKDVDTDSLAFFQGRGCEICNHTGYHDRTGVFEILMVNDALRSAILERQSRSLIREMAKAQRLYLPLREAGLIKALNGETTLAEVLGMLSYSEKQSFGEMSFTLGDIEYWMG